MLTMDFDFKTYIDELREDEKNGHIIDTYEQNHGPIEDDIRSNYFYRKHMAPLETGLLYGLGEPILPAFLSSDEKDLLLRFICISPSIDEYRFEYRSAENECFDILITVRSKKQDDDDDDDDNQEGSRPPQRTSIVENYPLGRCFQTQVTHLFELFVIEFIRLTNLEDIFENDPFEGKMDQFNLQVNLLRFAMQCRCIKLALDTIHYIKANKKDSADVQETIPDDESTDYGGLDPMVRRWHLLDIYTPMHTLKREMKGILEDPSAAGISCRLLALKIRHEKAANAGHTAAIRQMVIERMLAFVELFGYLTLREVLTLSRFWEVPFLELFLSTQQIRFTVKDIAGLLDGKYVGQDWLREEVAFSFYLHLMNIRRSCREPENKVPEVDALMQELPEPGHLEDLAVEAPEKVLFRCQGEPLNGNLIITGPTGCGKTSCIRLLCRELGLPLVYLHCNTLVRTGIVGTSIPDSFQVAYSQYSIELLRYGVVVADEFDKLRDNPDGSAIQAELLSLVDRPGEISFCSLPGERGERFNLQTGQMLFIALGVFGELEQFISRRPDFIFDGKELVARDRGFIDRSLFSKYGLTPELVGRFKSFIPAAPLSYADVLEMIDCETSPFRTLRAHFEEHGGSLVLTPKGRETLARRVCQSPYGVREMATVLNQALKRFLTLGNALSGTLVLDGSIFD